MDFQNAFDTVDHKILICKSNYGICGLSKNLFHRTLKAENSYKWLLALDKLICKELWKSILALHLSIICTNDNLYADDVNLLNRGKNK